MNNPEHHYDVLIVGTGNAACCAALAALDGKARVGIIEKAAQRDRGGNSALTTHMRFVYDGIDDLRPLVKNMPESELQKQIERLPHRTQAEIWDEFMRTTNGQVDEVILEVFSELQPRDHGQGKHAGATGGGTRYQRRQFGEDRARV